MRGTKKHHANRRHKDRQLRQVSRMGLLARLLARVAGFAAFAAMLPVSSAMAYESGVGAQADGYGSMVYYVYIEEDGTATFTPRMMLQAQTDSDGNPYFVEITTSSAATPVNSGSVNSNTYGNLAIGNMATAGTGTDVGSSTNNYYVFSPYDALVDVDGVPYYDPDGTGELVPYPISPGTGVFYVTDSSGKRIYGSGSFDSYYDNTLYSYVSYKSLTLGEDGKLYSSVNQTTDADGNTVYTGYQLLSTGKFDSTTSELVPVEEIVTGESIIYHATAVGNLATAAGTNSVALGNASQAASYDGIAIGDNASAGNRDDDADYNDGVSAIAVGANTVANGDASVAVGSGAAAYGYGSVATGVDAGAYTMRSIAIGDNAKVVYDADAASIEQKRIAENGIAIGTSARVEGRDASAIGYQSQALLRNATAYGVNSHANGWNSVAIGNKAIAGSAAAVEAGNYLAGQSAVAVGNRATAIADYSTAIGASTYADGSHALAVGDSNRATGDYSTAIGAGWSTYTVDEDDNDNTEAAREYSAIGANQATGNYSTAVGYNNATTGEASTAMGAENDVTGTGSIAIGYNNVIGEASRASNSSLATSAMTRAVAITGYALGSNITVTGDNGIAVGSSATVTADEGVAIGTGALATEANSVAIGAGSTTQPVVATSEVTIPGAGASYSNLSGTTPVGTVSVGSPGAERTITNVAAGRIGPGSTDAINGSELYMVREELKADTSRLEGELKHLDLDYRGAIAMALATAGMPQAYLPGKSMVAVGLGNYRGENGVALGVSTITDNGSWIFKLTGATSTRGNGSATFSVGYLF